jgi:osmotically inducible lipoprotein OsmB
MEPSVQGHFNGIAPPAPRRRETSPYNPKQQGPGGLPIIWSWPSGFSPQPVSSAFDYKERKMRKTFTSLLLVAFASLSAGCATWDSMSSREKSAVSGAAVGGVLGAAVSGGGVLSTVGGAAIGGFVGDQMGKRR